MPVPDRGTLEGLRGYLPSVDGAPTPAGRAFMDLDSALVTHANALGHLDRAEARFIAAQDRVGADQPARAIRTPRPDDAAHSAAERVGHYVDARAPDQHRHHGLGSRLRSFTVRQARERRLAGRVREAADRLHHAPVEACGDIALKLAAVIAAGEAGPPDASTFPWSPLRRLLADVTRLAGGPSSAGWGTSSAVDRITD